MIQARERLTERISHMADAHASISSTVPPPPSSAEDFEEPSFLTCPVHLRDYNKEDHLPHVIFPCGHTICREACVRESRCPLCRVSFRNHALNRGLLDVISAIESSNVVRPLNNEKNKFLMCLSKYKRIIETIQLPPRLWSAEQWEIFHKIVDTLKAHSDIASRIWIEASGCPKALGCELKHKLQQIRKIQYNRQLLGWEAMSTLPMAII
tara:strand:+ start:695 stop:1324 length:630 start_codon:yes stop_codon:yes gene_type:complete